MVAKDTLKDEMRRARNDVYRQHILEAAEQTFAERGFESAKLQEISTLAGVSMGTIYSIFASKEELFRAILDERGRELLALAQAGATRNGSPRAALGELIESYIGYFADHPHFLRMHLRLGTSWVLGPSLSTESQVQLWTEIHALQADLFRRGVAAGEFVDEDPAYLAKVFSAMDQVLLSDWVAGGMRESPTALVARLTALVDRAFRP